MTNSWGVDKRLTLQIPRLEALIPTEIDGPSWFKFKLLLYPVIIKVPWLVCFVNFFCNTLTGNAYRYLLGKVTCVLGSVLSGIYQGTVQLSEITLLIVQSLPGESPGQRSLVVCGVAQSQTRQKRLSSSIVQSGHSSTRHLNSVNCKKKKSI